MNLFLSMPKILVHIFVVIYIFVLSQFYKRQHRKLMNHGVGISSFRRPQTAKPVSKLVQPDLRPMSSRSVTSMIARRKSGKFLRFSLSENGHGDGPKTERGPKTAKGARKWDMKATEETKTFKNQKSRPATAPTRVIKLSQPPSPPTQV